MRLVMEIIAGKDVLSGLTTAHMRVRSGLQTGVRKAAMLVERYAKRTVYGMHPERLVKDKGGLGRSITTDLQAGGMTAVIGPNVIYAAIHEFGGIIKPKKPGGFLVFRPSRFETATRKVRGEAREYSKRTAADDLVFARKVEIPPRPYMHPALEHEREAVAQVIGNTLYEAVLR